MAGKTHVTIDWSVPQYCLECSREMRKSNSKSDGVRPKYGSRGYCGGCSDRLLPNGTLKPKVFIDWTIPQHCKTCKIEMEKDHTPGSGKNAYGHGGNCNACRGRELRVAQGKIPKYAQVFDEHGVVCVYCKRHKPFDEFQKDNKSASGFSSYCFRCSRLRHHKVDPEIYHELVESGTYCCQICDKTEEENGKRLAIDHDHSCCPGQSSCGKCFRGFLCNDCNWALGLFKDSVDNLDRAAVYLKKYEAAKAAEKN